MGTPTRWPRTSRCLSRSCWPAPTRRRWDSPASYTPLINSLRDDETIRRNYQFWFYSYPSGYPYPHSAAILRKELDAIEKRFPMQKKMVVIGHSMGGCISRLLVTDPGEQLWLDLFKKPPSQLHL